MNFLPWRTTTQYLVELRPRRHVEAQQHRVTWPESLDDDGSRPAQVDRLPIGEEVIFGVALPRQVHGTGANGHPRPRAVGKGECLAGFEAEREGG